jgi:hypothetical protein
MSHLNLLPSNSSTSNQILSSSTDHDHQSSPLITSQNAPTYYNYSYYNNQYASQYGFLASDQAHTAQYPYYQAGNSYNMYPYQYLTTTPSPTDSYQTNFYYQYGQQK